VRGGQLGFQRHDAGRGLVVVFWVIPKHQAEHLCDVSRVGRQYAGVLLIAEIGFVGQSDARLGEVHQITGRVFGVGIHIHADAAAHPGVLQRAEGRGQRGRIGGLVNCGQLVEQRLHAPTFDGLLVEEAGVEVADALCIIVRGSAGLAGFDDQVAHLLFRPVE
jgi:hypothetical protein